MFQYIEAQMEYHKRSVAALDSILPNLRALLGEFFNKNCDAYNNSCMLKLGRRIQSFDLSKYSLSCYLQLTIDEYELQPIYGCPLEDHLRVQERDIAFVIEECVTFLYKEAMDVQVVTMTNNFQQL